MGGSEAAASGVGQAAGCELCEAASMTPWYFADELCWIADCESCDTPMVVWRHHGAEPPPADVAIMLGHLSSVAAARFGDQAFSIDRVMRQIPDHFHAHARDRDWWSRRLGGYRGNTRST